MPKDYIEKFLEIVETFQFSNASSVLLFSIWEGVSKNFLEFMGGGMVRWGPIKIIGTMVLILNAGVLIGGFI